MPTEPVTDLEIEAYLDGELDLARSLAVEQHLAADHAAAARVIADMRNRSTLRLLHDPLPDAPGLDAAAARLAARLDRPHRRFTRMLTPSRAAAAVAVVALLGDLLTGAVSLRADAAPPTYVSDAVEAFHTGLLRIEMASQAETRTFDPRDVQRYTRIRVPTLPAGWKVTDVQLFPSDEGPALQIMVRTDAGRIVSIFAVRSAAAAPGRPTAVRRGAASVAYWRNGDMAYALTGMEAPAALDLAAQDLADNRLS